MHVLVTRKYEKDRMKPNREKAAAPISPFLSAMFVIADTLKEKLRASGSNMRAHVVHALYSSFFFCNTPLIWLCMKAVAKDLGRVLLLDSE